MFASFSFCTLAPERDAILEVEYSKFLSDLGIDEANIYNLLLAWKCNAEVMFTLSKEEFFSGCQKLKFVISFLMEVSLISYLLKNWIP